ncbi:MAG: EAL domain-containing protein [Burkholderiales bacterium]|jgi:diguanylate cyclase|nr:EAL domain-containing protein [Burkholderiales bacterium]
MTPATGPPRRRFTLQQRLTVIAMLITLPFLGHTLWTAWNDRNLEYKESGENALVMARLAAADVSKTLVHTRQLLALFAATINHSAPLHTLCQPLLHKMVEQQVFYLQAVVAQPDGHIVCGVNPVPEGSTIADRDYFQRAMASQSFTTSGLVYSRTTGKRTIAAGYPITDPEGRVRGALAVSIDLEWLQRLFERIQLPEGMLVSLVDSEGMIVFRYPLWLQTAGKLIPDVATFLPAAAKQPEGIIENVGHDAVDRIVAFVRLDGDSHNPLYLRTGVARTSIEAQARSILISGLTIFAMVWLMAGAFAWFTTRKLVVDPVRKLIDATQRMGIGDIQLRTGLADDRSEIGKLAGAFDGMAARLQRSVRALRALSAGNRTIIRRQTEQELLDAMCAVAVEKGGYPLAIVYYALTDDEKTILIQAYSGGLDIDVPTLKLTWADNRLGRGPEGTAVRTGNMDVIHDVMTEPRFEPWREMAKSLGVNSVISLPLKVEGAVIGTFTLAAPETEAFDTDEIELLEEMAADLSFGIETIRSRAARDAAYAAAEHAARHDPGTGLPNRATLVRRLSHLLRIAQSGGAHSTLLVAHMPRMKDLLDGLGYDPSNQILAILAARLKAFESYGGFIARISFDEFGVALSHNNIDEAAPVVMQLRRAFEQAVDIQGALIEVQVSIGLAMMPDHGDEPDLLLRRAGLAAREAARRDLSSSVYSGATERQNPLRLAMVAELRRAMELNELTLHYQPKVDILSGKMLAVEALVRWIHPAKGMIPPAQFIPLAEQTGLIRQMTFIIIEAAARQQAAWLARGLQTPIAVNLAARSLADPQFVPRFSEILARNGVPTSLIDLEITESSLIEDPEGARNTLLGLRDLGCRIYIDDFGTGYSSLSYLVNLPVHSLKIDRSFITGMGKNQGAYLVVASVISMAQSLGLRVVAEGVETTEDVDRLRELGCDEGQGYLYCKPQPAAELEALWESGKLVHASACIPLKH